MTTTQSTTSASTEVTTSDPNSCTGQNEVFDSCSHNCEASCTNPNPTCNPYSCVPACVCQPGFVRDQNGECIDPAACGNCGAHATWTSCGLECTATCEDPNPLCQSSCIPRCECDVGFLEDFDGNCVPTYQCPTINEGTENSNDGSAGTDGSDGSSGTDDTNEDSNNDTDSGANDESGSNSNSENGSSGENNGGMAGYGDPHFHVLGRSSEQPDLCFDYDGDGSDAMTILEDRDNNIRISSTLFQADNSGKTYFKSIQMVRS